MPAQTCYLTSLYDRTEATDQANLEFEALLNYLKQSRGCDLTGYKRSSLMRRFQYRMQNIEVDTYQNYLQYLRWHSIEHLALLNTVLINFTGFFRDSSTWDYLAIEVIPNLIATKQLHQPIRVWSAGCAAGQEIYSLLVLLAEAFGVEFCLQHVQCYATDADEDALQQARRGIYSNSEIAGIPPNLLKKYFKVTSKGYVFNSKLRRVIEFEQHDLINDPFPSHVDLLLCRNVLMYFITEVQESILARFHFALNDTGFLFLGQAEPLVHYKHWLKPVDPKQKIYAKQLELNLDDFFHLPTSHRQEMCRASMQNYFWKTVFETGASVDVALKEPLV